MSRLLNKIKSGMRFFSNNIRLWGSNVQFSHHLKLENNVSVITDRGGKISFAGSAVVRSGSEIFADGGVVYIGSGCFINRNCMLISHSRIEIGSHTTIGPNVVIYDHDHNYKRGSGVVSADVKIGNDVWIGANVIILKGTVIGDHCVIGAGTLLKGTIEASTMVYCSKQNVLRDLQ